MIVVKIPDNYENERRYILAVMLTEFLGLEVEIKVSSCKNTTIVLATDRQIEIADLLFSTPVGEWLKAESLPQQPLKIWDMNSVTLDALTVEKLIPIIYGEDPDRKAFFSESELGIYIGLDIFGSAFFMLTRYEEVVKPDRDRIDRFPAAASLASQEDFLTRPIVNEYLEILWACLRKLAPNLQRKTRTFKVVVSHDVDEPFRYAFSGIDRLMKRFAGDIYRRHSLSLVMQSISQAIQVKSGNYDLDPCNTFDLIMDISERNNITSAFYFIAGRTAGLTDCDYSLEHPLIRSLLRKIHHRGHEIGLHTSYHTYKDSTQTKKEFEILKQVCLQEGIEQQTWGGRQHYLRWNASATFQNWNDAGLNYDSTLSYAEEIGFRCGICYEFPTFNLQTKKQLDLRERPLVIMECTLFRNDYMALGLENGLALQYALDLRKTCKKFCGDFTILWHNNGFADKREIDLYKNCIL